MNPEAEALYGDIVELHNRTDVDLEFTFDSRNIVVTPKKAHKCPRHIALHAISKHPTLIDSSTGIVTESLFGIDDDPKYPITKLKGIDLETLKDEDKLDAAVISPVLTEGKATEMEMVDVTPKKRGPGRPPVKKDE